MRNLVQVQNKSGRVSLNESVSKESMDRLLEEIDGLFGNSMVGKEFGPQNVVCQADDAVETLTLEINSGGGSVIEGVRLFHALRELQNRGVRVVANIVGLAGSMASVIAMAANEVQMARGSQIMIHEASTATHGDARAHHQSAQLLENISAEIAGFYSEKTGLPVDEVRSLMKEETWMGVDQALSLGFIDRITGENQPTNQTDTTMSILDKFKPDEALQAKVENLETDLATALTELQEARNEEVAKDEKIANLVSEQETLTNQLAEAKTKAEEAETAKADAEAKATPEAIQALVDASMAKAGVEPAEVIENSEHSETDDAAFKAKWADASIAEIFALKKSDPEAFNRLQSLTN